MSFRSAGEKIRQSGMGAAALAPATGNIIYVDSSSGIDGRRGESPEHAVLTLTRALALAGAGDLILLNPGGSETITAGLSVASAGIKILCPVSDPSQGFTLTGAGTLDLLTLSADDCTVEGVLFAHTGATSSAAGIQVAAGVSGATIRRCRFDDSAIVTNFTGFGVETVNNSSDLLVEGCEFLDCLYGVKLVCATGTTCTRPKVIGGLAYVGQANAFAVGAALAGTGAVVGLVVEGLTIVEADGDGSAATAAWDGSDNTDATQGTFEFPAAVDQFLVTNCRAYEARGQAFETLGKVNAGAAGDFASNATGTGSDTSAAVTSVGTLVSSAISATQSYGTAGSTANSSSLSAVVSVGSAYTASLSSGLSATVSYGVAGSTANSSSLSAVVSTGTICSSGLSATQSYGTAGSTANSSSLSAVVSYGVAGSTANSSSLSAVVSYGVAGSTANSSSLSAVVSYGTAGSTANSSSLSAVVSVGTLAVGVGSPIAVGLTGLIADNAIDNNTQGAGNTICTASGTVLIEEIILAKDGTNLAGPTNWELTTDAAYGLTGVNGPVAVDNLASLAANKNNQATKAAGTAMERFVLMNGEKIYLQGDDAAGSSGGSVAYSIVGRALTAGASIS
jgi:hypothetical protein